MTYPPYPAAPPAMSPPSTPVQPAWPPPYQPPYGYGPPRAPTNVLLYLGAILASIGGMLIGIGWLLPDTIPWWIVMGVGWLMFGPGLGMAFLGLAQARRGP